MKKLISLLIALTMCVSLAACGDNAKSDTQDEQQTSSQQTQSQDTATAVTIDWYDVDWAGIDWQGASTIGEISVNAKFQIFFDENGNILNVVYMDDNAKAVGAKLNLTGVAYEEGLKMILEEAFNQGFIESEASISAYFACKNENDPTDWTDVTGNVVTDFEMDHDVTFEIDFDTQYQVAE